MVFSENLKKNNIILKVKSSNRWDLIEEILDYAVKNKEVKNEDRENLKNAIIAREKSMSTGIGKGVAIPHCTTDKVDDIVFILTLCEKGIDFDSIDNLPVKIAVFLLVPKKKLKQHIKTLANVAKIMNDEDLRERLLKIKTTDSLIKTIKDYEKTLKK